MVIVCILRVTNGATYWVYITKQDRRGIFILQARIQGNNIDNKKMNNKNPTMIYKLC